MLRLQVSEKIYTNINDIISRLGFLPVECYSASNLALLGVPKYLAVYLRSKPVSQYDLKVALVCLFSHFRVS